MKRIILIFSIVFSSLLLYGSNDEKPSWVSGYFKEMQYSYLEVVHAFDYDLPSARNRAISEIISRRSIATGTEASVSINNSRDINVSAGHELIVKSRIIDEYVDHTSAGYTVYLLVQTAKNPTFEYDPVHVTNEYGFSARVLVPGMAQIYKGSVGKGVVFIAGEVAAIGGIVVCQSMRSSYLAKASSSHNAEYIKTYTEAANRVTGVRNGLVAGAVALYAWNVIDGIVAKGKKHIVAGNVQFDFNPYMATQDIGLMLTMKF